MSPAPLALATPAAPEVLVIEPLRLLLALLPMAAVLVLLWRWDLGPRRALVAVARMVLQLVAVGYVLEVLFEAEGPWPVLAALAVMSCAAGWIALGSGESVPRRLLLVPSIGAVLLGGGVTLAVMTAGVLGLDPWWSPRYLVPLAGMTFSNSMNGVSLAVERLLAERARGVAWEAARGAALRAGLIPATNGLLAVGLVSIPGMMTGQVLAGVSPLLAARYQMMVMAMIFGAAGLSTAAFLVLARRRLGA